MRPILLLPLLLVLGGCARYPNGAGAPRYTRLTFRITMDGPVAEDSAYFYGVAIRPFLQGAVDADGKPLVNADGTPKDDGRGPEPVLALNDGSSGSRNGFVEGRATRLIRYQPSASIDDYFVYRFFPSGDPDDSTDIDPSPISAVVPNSGVDPNAPPPDSPVNTLGFTIETRDLVDDLAQAQQVVGIQFNIIVANKPLRYAGDASGRGIDAIGDQGDLSQSTVRAYFPVSLLTSDKYPKGNSVVIERRGDVFGVGQPSIDIKSWSLRVDRP